MAKAKLIINGVEIPGYMEESGGHEWCPCLNHGEGAEQCAWCYTVRKPHGTKPGHAYTWGVGEGDDVDIKEADEAPGCPPEPDAGQSIYGRWKPGGSVRLR